MNSWICIKCDNSISPNEKVCPICKKDNSLTQPSPFIDWVELKRKISLLPRARCYICGKLNCIETHITSSTQANSSITAPAIISFIQMIEEEKDNG